MLCLDFRSSFLPQGNELHNGPAASLSAERNDYYKNHEKNDGPDVIRTHDLPVISRAHHRAMLRAQKFALNLP